VGDEEDVPRKVAVRVFPTMAAAAAFRNITSFYAAGQCRVGFLAGSEASISRRARLHERTTACISCSAIRVISFMC
jgi:hypothetical protein